MGIPPAQKMERQSTIAKEHMEEYKAAIQRAVALDIPIAYSPSSYGTFSPSSYGTFQEIEKGQNSKIQPDYSSA